MNFDFKLNLMQMTIEQSRSYSSELTARALYTKSEVKLHSWDKPLLLWMRFAGEFICILHVNDSGAPTALEHVPVHRVEYIMQLCETCSL